MKIFLLSLAVVYLFGDFEAKINPINKYIKQRMIERNSWHKGCPVKISDLRYIRVKYHNFYRSEKMGEMIVHKDVAREVVSIFNELYETGYPIRQMRLISDFMGNDWRSIEADNTSAFNCRKTSTKGGKWSKHAYGKAIDINPIENPFISKHGKMVHIESYRYKKRKHRDKTIEDKAVLLKKDKVVKIFKQHGWRWGGDFNPYKDYQHFAK